MFDFSLPNFFNEGNPEVTKKIREYCLSLRDEKEKMKAGLREIKKVFILFLGFQYLRSLQEY